MNRLECIVETIRATLNSLSEIIPDWIANQLPADWKNRYGPRAEDFRLPKTTEKRNQYAQQIGLDGFWLMNCLDSHEQASFLWKSPAVDLLRRVWLQRSAAAAFPTYR